MVVVDRVRVEQFSCVLGIVTSFLQPNREEVVVQPLAHKLWVSSVWRVDVCDIGVVRSFSGPQRDPRWAAKGDGAEMSLVEGALVQKMFAVQVLVVSQYEDNVWASVFCPFHLHLVRDTLACCRMLSEGQTCGR
jgi:hypothetical protein